MARARAGARLLLAAAVIAAVAAVGWAAAPAGEDPRLAELRALRSKSRDRIIVLSTEQFERYASLHPPGGKSGGGSGSAAQQQKPPQRPYALAVFMSAKHMMDSPKTRLRDLRFEYSLAAKAFADAPPVPDSTDPSAPPPAAGSGDADADADSSGAPAAAAAATASPQPQRDVFFVELWHHTSKDLFGRLGVKALPMVFVISPDHPGPKSGGGQIKIPEADEMGHDGSAAPGFTKYPWAAEEMLSWLRVRVPTARAPAPVDRPSFIKSPLFPLAFAAVLAGGAAAAWRLYSSPLARHKGVWGAGALAVWWFSVSGGMFNIIRGMPLIGIDPRNPGRVAWWSSSRSVQFGMEGFVMGSSYVLFSVLLGSAVFTVPKIKSRATRGGAGLAVLALAWLVLMRILAAYDAKTSLGRQRQFIGFI